MITKQNGISWTIVDVKIPVIRKGHEGQSGQSGADENQARMKLHEDTTLNISSNMSRQQKTNNFISFMQYAQQ